MANWTGGVLTKKGRALLAQVEAGEVALNLTKIKLGDGIESIDDVDDYIDLQSPKYEMGISSRSSHDNICKITSVVASSEITEGFYAREWGLFANDKDNNEILYMIAVDDKYDWIPCVDALVKISATYVMNAVISNAANIVVEIDYNSLVNVNQLASAACLVRRETAYSVGDILRDADLRPGVYLACIQGGTTAKTELLRLNGYVQGDVITDGTVKWQVVKIVTTANNDGFLGFKALQNGNITIDFKKQETSESEPEDNTDGDITYADNDVIDSMFN